MNFCYAMWEGVRRRAPPAPSRERKAQKREARALRCGGWGTGEQGRKSVRLPYARTTPHQNLRCGWGVGGGPPGHYMGATPVEGKTAFSAKKGPFLMQGELPFATGLHRGRAFGSVRGGPHPTPPLVGL